MTSQLSPEERVQRNRREHGEQRRREQAAQRGPRGVASAWWDQARAVAAREERDGDGTAWDRLCLALEAFCGGDTPQAVTEEAQCPAAP